jgi:hypothetical protein
MTNGHATNTARHASADGLQLLIVDDNRVIRDAVAALLVNEAWRRVGDRNQPRSGHPARRRRIAS